MPASLPAALASGLDAQVRGLGIPPPVASHCSACPLAAAQHSETASSSVGIAGLSRVDFLLCPIYALIRLIKDTLLDIEQARQSHSILESVAERAKLQSRLQQARRNRVVSTVTGPAPPYHESDDYLQATLDKCPSLPTAPARAEIFRHSLAPWKGGEQ